MSMLTNDMINTVRKIKFYFRKLCAVMLEKRHSTVLINFSVLTIIPWWLKHKTKKKYLSSPKKKNKKKIITIYKAKTIYQLSSRIAISSRVDYRPWHRVNNTPWAVRERKCTDRWSAHNRCRIILKWVFFFFFFGATITEPVRITYGFAQEVFGKSVKKTHSPLSPG